MRQVRTKLVEATSAAEDDVMNLLSSEAQSLVADRRWALLQDQAFLGRMASSRIIADSLSGSLSGINLVQVCRPYRVLCYIRPYPAPNLPSPKCVLEKT